MEKAGPSRRGDRPQVVIVGAGFGGLAAARRLARVPVDVTVIDRRNHHLFQPLLYQVATAGLSADDIAAPIRAVLRGQPRATVLLDEVVDVDTRGRRVTTRGGAALAYDFLILAPGSRYNYFGHDASWPALAPALKSLDDAASIKRRLLLAFERAESTDDSRERERLMTFVLVGGGSTGVEMAGAVAELAKAALARDFRRIDPRSARIILVEAGPGILPAFRPELQRHAVEALQHRGVEILLETPIETIDEGGVVAKGERIPAATVIWCAGVVANPAGEWLKVATERNGTVAVGPDLSVPGLPQVFVIGDAARVVDAEGRPVPGLAPVAKQQGDYVAAVIAAKVGGSPPPRAFRYRDRGMLATIGRSSAVVDLGGLRLTGFPAWLLWSIAHIYFLIGWRNRLGVFLDWAWSWATYKRGARVLTEEEARSDAREVRAERSAAGDG